MKSNIFLSVMKPFLLVSFLTLFNFTGYAQSGLNEKGQLITDAFSVIDKNGAKGKGTARDQYGRIVSMPLVLPEMRLCDGTQPTVVVEMISPTTGKIWMDRNLGAGRAATSKYDFYAYGCSYQWGRGNDGHASINWTGATTGTPVNAATAVRNDAQPGNAFITRPGGNDPSDWRVTPNTLLWTGVNGVNNPCPTGYRVPTSTELSNEAGTPDKAWLLKFAVGGSRGLSSGTVYVYDESMGLSFYWSSSVKSTDGLALTISNGGNYTDMAQKQRANGYPVRCIKN